MAEEILNNPLTPEVNPDIKVAPNLEGELDSALSKIFTDQSLTQPQNEAKPTKQEVKAEVKTEAKEEKKSTNKSESKLEVEKLQDTSPDELDEAAAEIKSEKNKDGWSVLKTNYKKAQRLAQEREEEIRKLQTRLAEKGTVTQKEVDDLKAQIQDLSKYRAMIDIQADPEFISKFDQPIEKNISSIKEMLLGMNVSETVVNQIDFSNTKLMDQIIGHVGEHQDKFIARKLQRKVEELIDLSDKRDETLSEQKEKYKEILENKKKETFSKEAEGQGRAFKHLENIALGKDREGNQKYSPIPFLNKMIATEGATQPQLEQIENHNKMVELMNKKVQEALKMNSPEEKAELAVAATASHYLSAQLKAATSRIKSLEDELKKISSVSNETVRSTPSQARKNGNNLDLDGALATHFAATR